MVRGFLVVAWMTDYYCCRNVVDKNCFVFDKDEMREYVV